MVSVHVRQRLRLVDIARFRRSAARTTRGAAVWRSLLGCVCGLAFAAAAAPAQPPLTPPAPALAPALEPARVSAADASAADASAADPGGAGLSETQQMARDQLYSELAAEVASMERMSRVVKQVARLVRPCVVHVEATKVEQTQGHSESFDEAGSGIIIRHGGISWVVTNRHVIAGAEAREISLRLGDGRTIVPTRVLSDPSTDVAILEIEDPQLGASRVGNSDAVEVGDFVLAIGSPFGLSHSVTFGIISATGRRDLTLGAERIELQDFFQTDAAINPGNSGGPLLNLRGEVIALNTAIASSSGGSEGIGFAIPINMVMQVVDQLVEHGRVRRAYLGVTLDPDFQPGDALRHGLPTPGGALVKSVGPESPAAVAGIATGDVIVEFDAVRIDNDDHLVARAGLTPIGKTVQVVLYRDGHAYQTEVRLAPFPQSLLEK